jgi:alcohol dehydrogenase
MKIKVAVLHHMGSPRPYAESRPIHIEEVDLDPPQEGEVLVRVAAAGVCHSDLSVVDGARPRPLPMVLGHEGSGVVEEVGPGVDNLAKGDHVVFVFVPSCGKCGPCLAGRPALCEPGFEANSAGAMLGGGHRLHSGGSPLFHQVGVSCFAEYAVSARCSLIKVTSDLPLEEAALFSCAVITGVGAVVNTGQVPAGVDVAFDANDDDVVDKVREATDGGVDFAFECVGKVETMELAYKITRRGGTTISSGLSHPDTDFRIQHVNLVAEERTIKGSYLGSCVPHRDIPNYIELYRSGRLPVDQLISERIELEDINEAFDRLADGHTVRQIITF